MVRRRVAATRASAARYSSIAPGQAGAAPPRRRRPSRAVRRPPALVPGSCSTSSQARRRRRRTRRSTSAPPMNPTASTGRLAPPRRGWPSSQPRIVASCRSASSAGMASSTRSGGAVDVAGGQGVPDRRRRARRASSYQWLARRCRSATSSGRSSSRCAAGRRRTGGGSGTSGGCRRAGPRTGWPGPGPPASPCRRGSPVTASHSGPVSRSRIEVWSRKSRTSLGLAAQHLLDQVVDDVPVVAGEAGDEAGDVGAAPQRQRGQLQRGDPALGARLQRGDVAAVRLEAGRPR